MNLKLALRDEDLKRGMRKLKENAPKACARALNRATASAKTVMVRSIAADTAIKSSAVREKVRQYNATPTALSARLEVSGARIPLIEFNAKGPYPSRGRGRGVSYRLPGSVGRNPNAFLAFMKSGHRGVFKRAGKARLGIVELFGPSLPRVFEKFIPAALARGEEQLMKNLASEFKWALQQQSAT